MKEKLYTKEEILTALRAARRNAAYHHLYYAAGYLAVGDEFLSTRAEDGKEGE